ncbi:MAG: EAL domain-containing protein [Rhodocyclales bacterium]|nr:EAL domain-containing protein [Rhodocyclales bacterium]
MRRSQLKGREFDSRLDFLLYGLSLYVIPIAIGFASLYAFIAFESQYPIEGQIAVPFRVLEQTDESLMPAEALQRLDRKALVRHQDTQLSESPFWFSFIFSPSARNDASVVEIPSRHGTELECWNADALSPLGKSDRKESTGSIRNEKTGFAIYLGSLHSETKILCKADHTGPARITVLQWQHPQFDISVEKFHRNAGLLDGGLIVLALFVLVTAIINKEWMYVLFAAWLVANLRLGALSAGWDIQWLERSIPPEWITPIRKFSIAAYYTLTYALFRRLFSEDLRHVAQKELLGVAQWTCALIIGYALVLPYRFFLPPMWLTAAVGVLVLVYLLFRILHETRSKVAIWYGASLGIAVFANLYEVISAALGYKGLIGAVNSVTAALTSSLMAAFAIAEQMRLEREARVTAQTELRNAYDAIPIGLFTLNLQGFFTQANPAMTDMIGLLDRKREHWSDHFEPGTWARLQDLVSKEAGREMEIKGLAGRDLEPKWFLVKATLSKEKIEGSLQDITERVKATGRLRFLAEHDPLTSILNRRGIEKVLDEAIKTHGDRNPMALAYLDLDRFKLINDLFGHVAGDEVLKQVCDRIREMLTDGQDIGRVGGDEFVIVFRGTSIQSATWTCRGIVERIATAPYQIGDRAFQVKGSIGLIEVAGDMRVKDVISVADRACREAKSGHHASLVVYKKDAPVFSEREEELRLVGRLGASSAPEGLFLMMQPIMSLRAPYDSLNFEVLLRMREADNSVTPAGKIIAAAESNGRISVIDRWVLSNTLQWLSTHYDHLKNTRFVCLNLSGGSLNDEKFIQDAFSMLSQYGRTVERLCIEITESVALHDLENTRRFIDKVRSFGAKIALDDFGAGYTSFSYLKELPADTVKIDGAFVQGVNAHPANLSIIEAIVELARNLGMKSIAEWAEDRATIEALAQVGVDYVQGFAIARPLLPNKILVAESSASFIEDDSLAQYVRTLASGQNANLLDQFVGPIWNKMH